MIAWSRWDKIRMWFELQSEIIRYQPPRAPREHSTGEPKKVQLDPVMIALTSVLSTRKAMTNQEVANRLRISKAEASKRVTDAVAAGIVSRQRVGKHVAITLH